MLEVNFYKMNEIEDSLLEYAVITARHQGKWVWVKNKKRKAWEVPGGHREDNEAISKTAKRELYEETGVIKFDIMPICVYSVKKEVETYGMLFHAEIIELGSLPETEIEEIGLFENVPENLSFPLIQPLLMNKVKDALQAAGV